MKQPCTIILFCFYIVFAGCNTRNSNPFTKDQTITIRVQPFNDIPQSEIDHVVIELTKIYPLVTVSNRVQLPDNALNQLKYRYRAESLLQFLNKLAKPGEVIIGLTARDISTTKGNIPDWGIMGLGNCPGYACVASSFRLPYPDQLEQLFKVAIHELGHTEGLPHCPNKSCFMRDAEGGNPINEEKAFCPKCKTYLKAHGWQLI